MIYKDAKEDLKEAAKYFIIASDNDHIDAMYMHAIKLFKGLGIHSDLKEAINLLKESTDLFN